MLQIMTASKPFRATSALKVKYNELKAKHQENYNFAKVSALLANFGFYTLRLSDDWQGIDFIAHNARTNQTLFVQLKGRFEFNEKYKGKEIYMCFPNEIKDAQRMWYLFPHDEMMAFMETSGGIGADALKNNKGQSRKRPSKKIFSYLKENGYELGLEGA